MVPGGFSVAGQYRRTQEQVGLRGAPLTRRIAANIAKLPSFIEAERYRKAKGE
jgi:hypothetical protein